MHSLKSNRRRLAVESLEQRALLAADWQAFNFPADGNYDFYLKLDSIPGESTVNGYAESIELESFSWGASTAPGVVSPTGSYIQELVALTDVSQASPRLLEAFSSGQKIPSGRLVAARKIDNELVPFYQVDLKDVTIASLQSRSLNGEIPEEQFSLRFSSLNEIVSSFESPSGPATKYETQLKAPRGAIWQTSSEFLPESPSSTNDVEAFLEITGIPGQTATPGKAGVSSSTVSIEIESFSWGMSRLGNEIVGQPSWGGANRQFAVQDFRFAAPSSAATVDLINAVSQGYSLPSATLRVQRSSNSQEFLSYKLSDILVSSYQIRSLGNELPTEEFTLNFSKIGETYQSLPTDPSVTGKWEPSPSSISYVPGVSILSDTDPSSAFIQGNYIKLDGIQGESTLNGYQGAIEANSFSWGLSRPVTGRTSIGRAVTDNLVWQDLRFVSDVSAASPQLLQNLSTARRSANVTLNTVVSSPTGASPVSLLKLELSDVLVSSLHQQGVNGTTPVEEAGLNFQKIRVTRASFQNDGALTTRSTAISNNAGGKLATYSPGSSLLQETPTTGSESQTYLKFAGLAGSSTDAGFKGAIEVDSFSWGLRRVDLDSSAGRNGTAPRFVADAFQFVSEFDASTSPLYLAALNRGGFASATLATVRAADEDGGSPPPTYLTYQLEDVKVTGFQARGGESEIPQQLSSLSFMKIRETVTSRSLVSTTAVGEWAIGKSEVSFTSSNALLDATSARSANVLTHIKLTDVPGESLAAGHFGETEVLSFGFGAAQADHARKPNRADNGADIWVQDLHVVTDAGFATPALTRLAIDGKLAKDGVLTISRSFDDQLDDFMKIRLSDVVVSSYSTRGKSGHIPLEEVALSFAKIQLEQNGTKASFDWATAPSSDWRNRIGSVRSEVGQPLIDQVPPRESNLQIYLKLDGLDAKFAPLDTRAIDIDSYSWGLNRTVTRTPRGIGIGRPEFTDLSLTAEISSASPAMLNLLAQGKRFSSASMVVYRPQPGDQAPQDYYLKYSLQNLAVATSGVARGPDALRSSFGLRFGRVSVTTNIIPSNSARALLVDELFAQNVS
ncbi:MAG: type VI secretion system tube protein Hcp [Pirellulales bacterium]